VLAQVVLSLSVVIVSGADDRELARQIDEARSDIGDARPADAMVISFRHGAAVRGADALASLTLEPDRSDPWAAPDPDGAVELALAILEHAPDDQKYIFVSPAAYEITECALRRSESEIRTWPFFDENERLGDSCLCPSEARDVHHPDQPTVAELCRQLRDLNDQRLALALKIALTPPPAIDEPRADRELIGAPLPARWPAILASFALFAAALALAWRLRVVRGTI